jgi:hypothetical protein
LITIQNVDEALKDYYLEAFTSQMNSDVSPFFNAIEKSTTNVFGKDVKLSIVKGTMGSILAGDEDGDLPKPYYNRYYNITMPLKNIYGTIELSDKAIRASRDSSGAFVNLLNAEMEGLVNSAKANFSRMLFGDGNGFLTNVKGRDTSTSIIVENIKNSYLGMTVDIRKGSEVVVSGLTVLGINQDKKAIIVDREVSNEYTTNGHKLYVSGAYGKELCGLDSIFNSKELYGYTKSENFYFKPYVETLDIDTFSEDDLVNAINTMDANFDSKINMIICSHKIKKMIAGFLKDSRRVVNSTDIAEGYSSVIVNDINVYADKYCPDEYIYLLNTDDFCLNQLCDWEWLEDEDGKILRQVNGKAAYTATLVKYAELICKKPCGQGMIELV